MKPIEAVLASHNENKLRELAGLLPGWELELLGAVEFPEEAGPTYYDNALAKARFGREHGQRDAWAAFQRTRVQYSPYASAIGERLLYGTAGPLPPPSDVLVLDKGEDYDMTVRR